MNQQEAYQLLSLASARDGRAVDGPTAMVWADDLERVSYEDGVAAVRMHFRESTEYLRPVHVIANVKRVREQAAREPRIERQLESRAWDLNPGQMERVARSMYHSGRESEKTMAYIEGLFAKRGWSL